MRTPDKTPSADRACSSANLSACRALKSPPAITIFLLVATAGLAADLLSKHYVFNTLLSDPSLPERLESLRTHHSQPQPPERILAEMRLHRPVAPGVQFTLSVNPGVVFGTPMPRPLITAATVVTVAVVTAFFAASPARARWTHTALALVAAGALGNLYDRLFAEVALPGLEPIRYHVRDFIDCSQIGYKWIFNLADAYLVVGAAMLILHWLLEGRRAAKARPAR